MQSHKLSKFVELFDIDDDDDDESNNDNTGPQRRFTDRTFETQVVDENAQSSCYLSEGDSEATERPASLPAQSTGSEADEPATRVRSAHKHPSIREMMNQGHLIVCPNPHHSNDDQSRNPQVGILKVLDHFYEQVELLHAILHSFFDFHECAEDMTSMDCVECLQGLYDIRVGHDETRDKLNDTIEIYGRKMVDIFDFQVISEPLPDDVDDSVANDQLDFQLALQRLDTLTAVERKFYAMLRGTMRRAQGLSDEEATTNSEQPEGTKGTEEEAGECRRRLSLLTPTQEPGRGSRRTAIQAEAEEYETKEKKEERPEALKGRRDGEQHPKQSCMHNKA